MPDPSLDRLLAQLNVSGLQQTNNPAYQVIVQLIKTAKRLQDLAEVVASGSAGLLANSTFLTATNETATLINSKELVAGLGIAFDDSVAGRRTISSVSASGGDHVVMSDGFQPPTPMDDGNGNFIYVSYTP